MSVTPPPARTAMLHVAAVLLLFCAAFFLAHMALLGRADLSQMVNSDLVQPFLVMHDFLREPGSLADWTLSPALYVFPDYLLAALAMALPIPPIFRYLVNMTLLSLLMTFGGGLLLSAARASGLLAGMLLTGALLLAMELVALIRPDSMGTHLLAWTFLPFIHSGAVWSGVMLLAIWTRVQAGPEAGRGKWIAAGLALSALSAWSDLTYLVYFAVPVAVAAGISIIARRSLRGIGPGVLLVLVSVAGYLADRLARPNLVGIVPDLSLSDNIAQWTATVLPHAWGDPLLLGFLAATPLMVIRSTVLVVQSLRHRDMKQHDFAEIAVTGVQAASLVVPGVFGAFVDAWSLRYSLPVAIMPLLWLMLVACRTWPQPLSLRRLAATAAAAWLGALAFTLPSVGIAATRLTAPPPFLTCMHALGLDAGISSYWHAKHVMFLSDYAVHLIQVVGDGRFFVLNGNLRWRSEHVADGSPIIASFVAMEGLQPDAITSIYGTPSRVETCDGNAFWIYDQPLPPPPLP